MSVFNDANGTQRVTQAIRAGTKPKEMVTIVDKGELDDGTPVTQVKEQSKVEMVRLVPVNEQKKMYNYEVDTSEEEKMKREMVCIVADEKNCTLDTDVGMKRKGEMVKIVEHNEPVSVITDIPPVNLNSIGFGQSLIQLDGVSLLSIPCTNAKMAIVEVIEGDFSRYKCLISINDGPVREKFIPVARFTDGKWLKELPCFGIFDASKGMTVISEFLNQYVMSYQGMFTREVSKPGWTLDQGQFLYITPNGVLGKQNVTLRSNYGQRFPEISPEERIGDVKEFLGLGRLTGTNPTATIICLYIVIAFLSSLFKSVDMTIKFTLFLHGPRGCLKTSLALAMTQIEDRSTPKYTLRATCAGLEAGFKRYKDAIMLIDDLCPTQDSAEQRALHHNLETVRRCFGDATANMRNHEYCDNPQKEQYEAEGGAIITGEYITGVGSSLSRSLFISLQEGDVDVALLSQLQNDKKLLARFLVGFFAYMEQNMQQKLMFIHQRCSQYRDSKQGQYSNRRYAEYYGNLKTASELLLQYGYDTGQLTSEEVKCFSEIHHCCISTVIEENSSDLQREEPIAHMCNAIIEGIESGVYPLVELGSGSEACGNMLMQDEYYFYIPQPLLKEMREVYDKKHGNLANVLTSSSKYISDLLYQNNVIEMFREGKTKRYSKKMQGCGSVRFALVKKRELKDYSTIYE